MKKLTSLILLFTLLFSGCQPTETLEQYKNSTLSGFDTVFTLLGFAHSQEEFDSYFTSMQDLILYYHQLFDKYNNYEGINNIKTINDNAGIEPVQVDPVIIELLLLSKEWYEKTDGYLDITIGSVLTVWHNYRDIGEALNQDGEYGPIPTMEELKEAAQYTGWEYVEINEENSTVFITNPKVSIDVGAVAKGFAVEKIAVALEEQGLEYGVINGGGNVRTINSKPNNESWNIGITEPDALFETNIDVIRLFTTNSVVTSGDYQRYYIAVNGERMHHIINPFTLMPTQTIRAVSVITEDSGIADALSTYFSIATYEEGVAMVKRLQIEMDIEVVWLMDQPQEEQEGILFFYLDGFYVYMTSGLKENSFHFNP